MRPGQSCPGVAAELRVQVESHARGFNEAGAIMPRSGEVWQMAWTRLSVASMRPGQSCPGVGGVASRSHHQASSGFNEAGAIMPRSGESMPS